MPIQTRWGNKEKEDPLLHTQGIEATAPAPCPNGFTLLSTSSKTLATHRNRAPALGERRHYLL